jgi:pimeloyl-ACP methyl ester carboxylesterase
MARAMPEVPGVSHRQVRAGDITMHVAEAGEGEAVLLLHGWPQHWFMWRHVIPRLAERWRVICPDLRGLGWSDAPPHGYDKETMASDVLALMDELGLDRVRLVGHDWGGLVGFLMCLRAPERFPSYLVMNTGHPWLEIERRPAAILQALRLWYQFVLSAPLLGRLAVRPLVQASYRVAVDHDRVSPEEWKAFADQFSERERVLATVLIYRTFLTREFMPIARGRYADKRLTVPTLFLVGEDDPVVKAEVVEPAKRQADDLSVEVIPGVGHFIADERGDLVADRALDFLGR